MKARDIMTATVVTISSRATLGEAAQLMLEKRVSCLPVVDENNTLVGILTHSDFGLHRKFIPLADNLYTLFGELASPDKLEQAERAISNKTVESVMTHPVVTVNEDDSVAKVANLMASMSLSKLPVLKDRKVVGIITQHDILKLIASQRLVVPKPE